MQSKNSVSSQVFLVWIDGFWWQCIFACILGHSLPAFNVAQILQSVDQRKRPTRNVSPCVHNVASEHDSWVVWHFLNRPRSSSSRLRNWEQNYYWENFINFWLVDKYQHELVGIVSCLFLFGLVLSSRWRKSMIGNPYSGLIQWETRIDQPHESDTQLSLFLTTVS